MNTFLSSWSDRLSANPLHDSISLVSISSSGKRLIRNCVTTLHLRIEVTKGEDAVTSVLIFLGSYSNYFCVYEFLKGWIRNGEALDYDKEKYREMLLEAAETVLGFFGFDTSIFGDIANKKYRKWWHKLREDRLKDIESEIE